MDGKWSPEELCPRSLSEDDIRAVAGKYVEVSLEAYRRLNEGYFAPRTFLATDYGPGLQVLRIRASAVSNLTVRPEP